MMQKWYRDMAISRPGLWRRCSPSKRRSGAVETGGSIITDERHVGRRHPRLAAAPPHSLRSGEGGHERPNYTTVLWRSMQVCSTSSIGLLHQCSENISISE